MDRSKETAEPRYNPVLPDANVSTLVLSRRPGEGIVIEELNMEIFVSKVRGRVATIGIRLPRNVTVMRREQHGKDKASGKNASQKTAKVKGRGQRVGLRKPQPAAKD